MISFSKHKIKNRKNENNRFVLMYEKEVRLFVEQIKVACNAMVATHLISKYDGILCVLFTVILRGSKKI